MEVVFVCIAGVLGTLSRYGTNGLVYRYLDRNQFPYGTLIVNVVGSFIIGVVLELAALFPAFPKHLRIAIPVGFLGAFTTFSAFSYETVTIFEQKLWGVALTNVIANVVGCCLACWLGIYLVRAILLER